MPKFDEWEVELVKDYPDILSRHGYFIENVESSKSQITRYGFQFNSGWECIVRSLCECIKREDADIKIDQIKEKYGGLRVYYNQDSNQNKESLQRISGIVNHAKSMSFHICENCGNKGEYRDTARGRTLCDDCY